MAGKGVLLEGVEVVLIVAALAGGTQGAAPALAGAAVAVLAVAAIGVVVHRPLARLPESHLKYAVGLVLTSFGVFFLAEGLGAEWPGGDAALLVRPRAPARGLAGARAAARAGAAGVRTLRKLIFGETRVLPASVAAVLVAGLVLRHGGWWQHGGGFVLLAGAVAALSLSLRRAGADHPGAGQAASPCWRGRRREITLDTPLPAIDTPYSESADSIVRFWCVTTMNCARPENERRTVRKRSMLRSSSAASTSSRM